MEALIILAVLVVLALAVFGIYVLTLSLSTMRMHRQAMHALHQKIERDRLREQQESVLGAFPQQRPAPEQEKESGR